MRPAKKPRVGDWYQDASGENFEVIALDEDQQTVEIQYFDGAIDECDFDTWRDLDVTGMEPPEDWSGPLDIERVDYDMEVDVNAGPDDWAMSLDEIDKNR